MRRGCPVLYSFPAPFWQICERNSEVSQGKNKWMVNPSIFARHFYRPFQSGTTLSQNVKRRDKCMTHVVIAPSRTRALHIWGQQHSLNLFWNVVPPFIASFRQSAKNLQSEDSQSAECCIFSSQQRWFILYGIAIYDTMAKLTMSYNVLHSKHVLICFACSSLFILFVLPCFVCWTCLIHEWCW